MSNSHIMTDGLDIREGSARIRRIVVSLLVGVAVSALAWVIANAVVKPDVETATVVSARQMTSSGFVVWVTVISGALALTATLALQNVLARKKWREQHAIANARVV